MKIRGGVLRPLGRSVWGLSVEFVEAPLRLVLDRPVADLPDHYTPAPATIRYRENGKTRSFHGYLVHSTKSALLSFLIDRYVPSGKTDADRLLRSRGKRSDAELAASLEALLFSERDYDRAYRYSRYISSLSAGDLDALAATSVTKEFPALAREKLEEGFVTTEIGGRVAYLFRVDPSQGRVLFADYTQTVSGHRVTVRRWMVVGKKPVAGWDGQRPFSGQPPEPFLAALEASGRVTIMDGYDPLPLSGLEPVALVRAPSKAEAKRIRFRRGKPSLGRRAREAFRNPLFLVNSTAGVVLSRDLPVVDDPLEAMRILSRTKGKVYVPDDLETPAELADEPAYWVACRLA